jgi:hypothetical protein
LGTETAIRNGAPKLSWFNRGGEATPSTCLSRAMHAKSESNRSSSELSKPKKASSSFLLREKRNLNYWRARRREGGKAEAKIRAGNWRWREFGHIRKASVAHPLIICLLDSFTEFILRGESPILLPPAPGRPGAHKSRPLDCHKSRHRGGVEQHIPLSHSLSPLLFLQSSYVPATPSFHQFASRRGNACSWGSLAW